MYVSKEYKTQENAKKTKMLTLFNTLSEEDKDIVISMSDSLAMRMTNSGQVHEQLYAEFEG